VVQATWQNPVALTVHQMQAPQRCTRAEWQHPARVVEPLTGAGGLGQPEGDGRVFRTDCWSGAHGDQALHMCSEYEQHISYAEYCKVMQDLALGIPTQQTQLDLLQADHIKIGDMAPVIRAVGDNIVELAQMKFGFPPAGGRGPVFNLRSERRSFSDSHRCLVPASAFFERTGKKLPKGKHRFGLTGAPFMAIAAIWRPSRKGRDLAFAMLTTRPGPDLELFHNRQVVVLRQRDWKAWLDLEKSAEELLQPLAAGSLIMQTALPRGAICG